VVAQSDPLSEPYGALPVPNLSPGLMALVRTGKIYDLSFPISTHTPYAGTTSPFSVRMHQRHQDSPAGGAFGEATEILTMSSHTSTHIEALCHISEKIDGRPVLYGDIQAADVETEVGFRELGIERCPPIITRGLLLDLPYSKGAEVLPDSYQVTQGDLETCCHMAGVEIQPGDCVLIRTGFTKYRYRERVRFATVGAGPTPEACVWMADKGISLTGSDTMSFEQVPSPHVGHLELVRRRGISVIKQVNLEEIARDQVYQFLLIVLPLRLIGVTASPVTPIAIC
jgi:kynurenine formamidase